MAMLGWKELERVRRKDLERDWEILCHLRERMQIHRSIIWLRAPLPGRPCVYEV